MHKESSAKVIVIQNNYYTVYLEQVGEYTFIHLDTHLAYCKSMKTKMLHQLDMLMQMRKTPIFALNDPRDQHHKKYIDLMGFRFHMEVLAIDKKIKEVWIKTKR